MQYGLFVRIFTGKYLSYYSILFYIILRTKFSWQQFSLKRDKWKIKRNFGYLKNNLWMCASKYEI